MFKEIYATMNEVLNEIIHEYPGTSADKTVELEDQLHMLKAMNDSCLEEWTRFEERLNLCRSKLNAVPAPSPAIVKPQPVPMDCGPGSSSEHFIKGQGYYKLYMFKQAIVEFLELVKDYPDFMLGRVYLAMGYLRTGELAEANRHFQLLIPLTDNKKLKAISYSAMGCIQLQGNNADKAFEYLKMADLADSGCMEPGLWSKELWPYKRGKA